MSNYDRYGARGIKVCDRWQTFENFYSDMGPRPEGKTLERANNDGDYSPENCRWASRREQQLNRRVNRHLAIGDETKTIAEWSELSGVHRNTITQRADAGVTGDKLLAKEKMLDLSGLSLGGAANGRRNKAKTHCPHGHEYTAENIKPNGKDGKGRACMACCRLREANRRLAQKGLKVPR